MMSSHAEGTHSPTPTPFNPEVRMSKTQSRATCLHVSWKASVWNQDEKHLPTENLLEGTDGLSKGDDAILQ